MSTALIKELKENNQDFEWYPTTKAMFKVIYNDLLKSNSSYKSTNSVLDIGAGNGKLFTTFTEFASESKAKDEYSRSFYFSKKYAMEKSAILCEHLPDDVVIVGTDFHNQTLIDKDVDIIFCNPPYSEYEIWVERILKQGNCDIAYLIIPERWVESDGIKDVIKERRITSEVLDSFTFETAEDRKARAKVQIIRFDIPKGYNSNDAFSIWFDENFKIDTDASGIDNGFSKGSIKSEQLKHKLVKKENLIYVLENFYQQDMAVLLKSYKALEQVDGDVLRELGVDLKNIKDGLRQKIKGLKQLYWTELFNNLETITNRLCSKSRSELLSKLYDNTHVDFTAENAFAVSIWVIKNVNNYVDKQMLSVYKEMSDPENVKNYKSNTKFVNDRWRYVNEDVSHYQLDYRIVYKGSYALQGGSHGYTFDYTNNLHNNAHTKIRDIFTIAETLGYSVKGDTSSRIWESNKTEVFHLKNGEIFAEVKAFKNGNLHFKFSPEFMKKLNIAVGKLNGWLKNEEEAFAEMSNISKEEINEFWKTIWRIGKKDTEFLIDYQEA